MSVGFIMYEIVDKDSLKNQGINTNPDKKHYQQLLDIHLKIKALTPPAGTAELIRKLDIHLNIKVLTPYTDAYRDNNVLDIHLKIKVLTP